MICCKLRWLFGYSKRPCEEHILSYHMFNMFAKYIVLCSADYIKLPWIRHGGTLEFLLFFSAQLAALKS